MVEYHLNDWPAIMRAIAQAIGPEGALLLVREFGGLEYYIPRAIPSDHPLVQLLGDERVAALVGKFGGQRIAIPRSLTSGIAKGRIIALAEQGHDQQAIAREVGVTQRYVRRVLELVSSPRSATKPPNARQLALPLKP